ncbi:LOW QUALITY PROTEIN: subtilisin-like protease SBT4.4 [Neltuma alba]|uniref:LOW QUALITY PROTEIN: subtilisin-like protease SBT4.4 n=1 Tax=Neltuma alba TaxID=207710 RepID=UPI0010A4548D|nr:LOW QUALITY PROTEIN: subtilisin-like protease SBT4.4 [Prosopis alba]
MGSLPEESSYSPISHHLGMLEQVTGETDAASSLLIRSYKRSFNGFAAKLTEEQREKIARMEGVVSVFPNTVLHAHETRSWDFIGLVESVKRNVSGESDVIIGFLDTGIWPESESFTDKGFAPPPKKWKGTCAGGKNFTCNNKIIGARFYRGDSARDDVGHGSHTASIAAGNNVNGASFYGIAEGTARGGVPSARIAVYKTCDNEGCSSAGILAAFDDAIADGADILSLSLGGMFPPDDLYDDGGISIGSFHAMAKGLLTVQSAGNEGPDPNSVTSVAPWILSVAASTTDRQVIDKLVLGNGTTLVHGDSVNAFDPKGTIYPIAKCKDRIYSDVCECLKSEIQGKIVLCNTRIDIKAHEAGAVGAIVKDSGVSNGPTGVTLFPYLTLSPIDYNVVASYSRSLSNPEAEIMKSESIVDDNAPRVAKFSSRGPSIAVPEILKPDITAPGVNILAAYSPLASPSGHDDLDPRRVKYNIISGTSMACPHASGIAAYVKSFHPNWSPAAIKSAIMTTAKLINGPKDHFSYGLGHVNPMQAVDPGLVHDLSKQDYLELLCNLGYNTSIIKRISGDQSVTCPKSPARSLIRNTNFPSILIEEQSMKPFDVEINRTVTNVGFANSEYNVTVQSTQGINITVEPKVLSFKSLSEKQSFVVRTVGGKLPEETVLSSSLVWSDGTHDFRSSIIVNVLNSTRS